MSDDRYTAPTLADQHPELLGTRHPCGCGRIVFADQLTDVTGFPPGTWPDGTTHVCDGCLHTALNVGRLTRAAVAHYTGAPPAALARAREKDRAARARGERPMPGVQTLDAPAPTAALPGT